MIRAGAICALAAASSALAAESKFGIEVVHAGEDSIGQHVVYAAKEEIDKSSIMRVSVQSAASMRIAITSAPIAGQNASSAVSVIFLQPLGSDVQNYVGSVLLVCGRNAVAHCAVDIAANARRHIERSMEAWASSPTADSKN